MSNKPLIDPFIYNNEQVANSNPPSLQKAMDFDVKTKSNEEKLYIILYKIEGDDLEEYQQNCFFICIGRTNAFNDIKEKLISGLDIDVHRSKIITETKQTETSSGDRKYYLLPYEECISVYSFCISVKEFYSEDPFNIEDYNTTDIPETDDVEKLPGFLTAEQIEYRKLLNASFERDKFLNSLKKEDSNNGVNI